MSRSVLLCAFASSALVCGSLTLGAQDWPRWGGNDPGRNMYSPIKGLPAQFDPGKSKPNSDVIDMATTKNVKWVAKLGSQSYGNAVVAGGKVFVGTNNEPPHDPRYPGDRSILLCLEEKTGEMIWQLAVPKLSAGKAIDYDNLGILSSPTVEGNRVYLVSSRCELLCLDTEGMANGNDGVQDEAQYAVLDTPLAPIAPGPKDADIIWRFNMLDDLGVFPHNAANGAPVIIGDVVYGPTANGVDWTHSNIPFPFAPSFAALDKKTGKLLAVDTADIGPRIFHGQWSSPSTGVVNGKPLVFLGGGDGLCYAFDAKPTTGTNGGVLNVVWKADCNPPEYKFKDGKPNKYGAADGPSEVNATPVFYKNRVYVATGQDPEQGEGLGRLVCIDATKTGDISTNGVIWDYRAIKRSLSTVSIDPESGLLFIGDFAGYVHCLDAETGKPYWVYDMKAHVWGSTLVADGKVYVGDEDGDLTILPARKDFDPKKEKPLAEINFGGPIYSTAIAANGVLYVSTQTHLYALTDKANNGK